MAVGKSKGTMVLDIVKFVFDIMQTVSFMMFIEEEGIQIRGFGIMSLMRENLVDEAEVQVDALEVQVNNLETFTDSWGWIAPYMHGTYAGYVQAARDQIDAWRAWVTYMQSKEEKYGIRIYSSPTHAKISVDGTLTDFLTPHSFYDLPTGPTTFKLTYESTRRGSGSYEEEVSITKGKVKEVRWVLEGLEEPEEPLPKAGIRISSLPSHAKISIDDEDTELLTPQTFRAPPLSFGEHTFLLSYLSSEGKITFTKKVTIEKDKMKEFHWIFSGFKEPGPSEPSPKAGIHIFSSPTYAEISIDGIDTELLTPQTFPAPPLSFAKHTFLLSYVSAKKGKMSYEEDVTIEEDKLKEFRWILEET